MISYWVPVISVTHTLGFESKRCSYATFRSHSLSCFHHRIRRWFLNLLSKFHSHRCVWGSHDLWSENGFKIGVWRPEYSRRTWAVREREVHGQRPCFGHHVWRSWATWSGQASTPMWHTRATRPWSDVASSHWPVCSFLSLPFKYSNSLQFILKKKKLNLV